MVSWAAKLAEDSLTFTGCSEHICRQGRDFGGVWHTIHNCTAGQREVFEEYPEIGRLIPSNEPVALAQALQDLLYNQEKLTAAKAASLQAAQAQFCWERQASTRLKAAELVLT